MDSKLKAIFVLGIGMIIIGGFMMRYFIAGLFFL